MEEVVKSAGQFGFPAVVSLYLLVRFEQRISALTEAIQRVCIICERLEPKQKGGTNA